MKLASPRTLPDSRPWHRRASPLARFALAVYGVIVLYAGLAPWSGWRDLGVSPLAFLGAPLPRHITRFDLAVNVLAYLPLGALTVLALHPRVRGAGALLAALLLALLLAGAVESLQTYLPTRVASNVDLLTNVLGALAGATLALPLAEPLIDRGRLAQWRARTFTRDASALLVLLALWPTAQLWPGPMLFGNGQWLDAASALAALRGLIGVPPPPLAWGPSEFVLAEALVVAAATLAVGLALSCVVRGRSGRLPLLLALLVAALGSKTLVYAVSFGPERAFNWLTPGAFGGLALGLLALAIAALGTARAQLGGALLAVSVWLVAVNLVPDNPYHADWIAAWRPGRYAHFHALAQWIALAWPWLLLALLLALALRRRRSSL